MRPVLQTIRHDKDIFEFRLDRPPVNALDPDLVEALEKALVKAPEQGARAIVLSGSPGMFSAGLDVPALLALDRERMSRFWGSFFGLLRRLGESPVPVIAALTGHSPAGGAVLAIFCDYRIAAEGDFRIGLNEVQVGLPVPGVVYGALRRLTGSREAERLAVRGSLVDPQEALRTGLVNELTPPDRVVERALEEAAGLLALPARALATTRQTARADLHAICAEGPGLSDLETVWNAPETQAALKAMVQRLKEKSGK